MRNRDDGVTLLFVLVILALTAASVVAMVNLSESSVTRSRLYAEAVAAQALLSAGEATAVIALRRDLATSPELDHNREAWALYNQTDVAIEGGRFSLTMLDAQGLFNLQILGMGALLAFSICPWLMQDIYTKVGVVDFKGLFLVPFAVASLAAIALALFFRPPTSGPGEAIPAGSTPH